MNKTAVYVAGGPKAQKLNQWDIMTNDESVAVEYAASIEGGQWKAVEVPPPYFRKKRKKK